jgi:polyisoprenoid-binding protein YceI
MPPFAVDPAASAVLVEARSNVGPISFGSMSVAGEAVVEIEAGGMVPVSARIELPVSSLESGNSLYDAELRQRLGERRYPVITAELREAKALTAAAGEARFAAEGDITIHGTTRRLSGTVMLTVPDADTLIAEGREVVDMRDFEIGVPNVLLLKIYPDVTVQFRVTARRTDRG